MDIANGTSSNNNSKIYDIAQGSSRLSNSCIPLSMNSIIELKRGKIDMSLVISIHRSNYTLIAADGRSTRYEAGIPQIDTDNYEKIIQIRDYLLCSVGDNSFDGKTFSEFVKNIPYNDDIFAYAAIINQELIKTGNNTIIHIVSYKGKRIHLSMNSSSTNLTNHMDNDVMFYCGDSRASAILDQIGLIGLPLYNEPQKDIEFIKKVYKVVNDIYSLSLTYNPVGPLKTIYFMDSLGIKKIL